MKLWRMAFSPLSAGLSTVCTLAAQAARLRTSKPPETGSDAGSTRTRRTGAPSTGGTGTRGSSTAHGAATDAARIYGRRMTTTPQAVRSADAICPAGTDGAALDLLYGFARVLEAEARDANVDSTREALGYLQEAVSDTIDVIEGVA